MKKAVIFTLLGFFLLFGVSLVAGTMVFAPWYRILVDKPGTPSPPPGEMSWNTYKKVKLELGSFDLVNGLTKHDLETLDTARSLSFYYLVACLWLVVGMRFGFRWPHRKIKPGASVGD
jgi:4-amino-4-deoxy-L-arabinose transferase-like glycosyltransferase